MTQGFPVAAGKPVKFVFATPRDSKGTQSWKEAVRKRRNPILLDAVELSTMAFRRWREARSKGYVASSVQEIKDFVQNNPHAEVAMLVLAKGPWLKKRNLLGLCYFRRTWSNNIYLDVLTSHPLLARNLTSPVRGVGTALLYFVCCVAAEIGAKAIWGEATQNSACFYRKVFGRNDIDDRIYLDEAAYKEFKKRIEAKLATQETKPQAPAEPRELAKAVPTGNQAKPKNGG